jgi:hypothetical protein
MVSLLLISIPSTYHRFSGFDNEEFSGRGARRLGRARFNPRLRDERRTKNRLEKDLRMCRCLFLAQEVGYSAYRSLYNFENTFMLKDLLRGSDYEASRSQYEALREWRPSRSGACQFRQRPTNEKLPCIESKSKAFKGFIYLKIAILCARRLLCFHTKLLSVYSFRCLLGKDSMENPCLLVELTGRL